METLRNSRKFRIITIIKWRKNKINLSLRDIAISRGEKSYVRDEF